MSASLYTKRERFRKVVTEFWREKGVYIYDYIYSRDGNNPFLSRIRILTWLSSAQVEAGFSPKTLLSVPKPVGFGPRDSLSLRGRFLFRLLFSEHGIKYAFTHMVLQ